MISYDKSKIKESITLEQVFDLLNDLGADPIYAPTGIVCRTICHHHPNENGSRKLYYYSENNMFYCYSSCGSFDIFQLIIEVANIQWKREMDLNEAVRWVANRFGLSGEEVQSDELSELLDDWILFDNYDRISEIEVKDYSVCLKEYDNSVLDKMNYNIEITPWLQEGISQEVIQKAKIGYYPGSDMITIPHFDPEGRFVGLRGRALACDDVEKYGKYRPVRVMNQMYNHPLGMNLYGLNWNKENIQRMGKAILFESEKSVLKYASFFGWDNNISVACCGSNLSIQQMTMLIEAGAKEVIVAFDRQFQKIGDIEFKKLTTNLTRIHERYKNDVLVSFIFDKRMITGYKDAPVDCGKEKFLTLFRERIIL